MKTVIVTNRRSVRVIEVRTGEHRGNAQIYLQTQWQDETGALRASAPALWIPATSLDELIAALIEANNEIHGAGGGDA